jgi:serine/threonine-protein phosphatase 2A regulatory subunit B'
VFVFNCIIVFVLLATNMELQDPFTNLFDFDSLDVQIPIEQQSTSEVLPMETSWVLSCRPDLVKEVFKKSLDLIVTTTNLSAPVQASYQILLMTLQNRYEDVSEFVNEALLIQLMKLTRRQNPNEREMVLYLLHRVYAASVSLRVTLRQYIARDFSNFVDGSKSDRNHPGIKELLMLMQSIVSGFQTPLKETHTKYFQEHVLPLFTTSSLDEFGQELLVCVANFIQKERSLITEVVRFLIEKFPVTQQTDIVFNILADLTPCLTNEEFSQVQVVMYSFLVSCSKHQQIEIAEAGLSIMIHPTFLERIKMNIHIAYPLMCTQLQQNAVCHWNAKVNQMSGAIAELLREYSRAFSAAGQMWTQPRMLY